MEAAILWRALQNVLGEYPREEKHICMSHVSAIVWAMDEEVLRSLWSAPRMLFLAWFSVMKVCRCLTVKSFCWPVARMLGRFLLLYLTRIFALSMITVPWRKGML